MKAGFILMGMLTGLKRLDKIKNWSAYRGGGFRNAETLGKYKVEYYNDDFGHAILFWSPQKPCLVYYIDGEEAVMQILNYDKGCTIDGKMQKGDGTKEMVRFSFDYLRSRNVKKVYLTDASTIDCNGKQASLAEFYFYRYGKTWYEINFGFKPRSQDIEYYTDAERIRRKMPLGLTCIDFVGRGKFPSLAGIVWELIL